MTKQELIAYLDTVPGNPDIVLWNGLVEDYVPIDPDGCFIEELVKPSVDHLASMATELPIAELTDSHRLAAMAKRVKLDWDQPNPFVAPHDFERWYGTTRKQILVFQPIITGKSSTNYAGTISY